jgi:hypothetical protein
MPETSATQPRAAKPRKVAASAPAQKTQTVKRPRNVSTYSPEIAKVICEQLSEGIPLRQICRENEGFPAWRTVYDWMGRDPELAASIARARDIGYDAIAEECLLIADTPQFGQKQVMSDDGATTTIEDMLGHRKLQIETRLKLLAKFHPTKYGDKLGVHGVAGQPPVSTEDTGVTRLFELLRNAELKTRAGSA